MNLRILLSTVALTLFFLLPVSFEANAGLAFPKPCKGCEAYSANTDFDPFQLYAFFDLRDRESFFQVTNVNNANGSTFGQNVTVHVQIFNVDQNCNENNFFDVYTPNDTHTYNLRDILTNDSRPSGVVLPEDAYGLVVVTQVTGEGGGIVDGPGSLIGNFRVIDNQGYEYRTNAAGITDGGDGQATFFPNFYTFNYNTVGGVTLSDVVGIQIENFGFEDGEIDISNVLDNYVAMDIDIYNLDEVPFSCRNIIFACIDQDNPLLEELLAGGGDDDDDSPASVASFEYGINNAIPHSKGGELLCPGNIIPEGFVNLRPIAVGDPGDSSFFVGYYGLNNGNGRGSMDSFWAPNNEIDIF